MSDNFCRIQRSGCSVGGAEAIQFALANKFVNGGECPAYWRALEAFLGAGLPVGQVRKGLGLPQLLGICGQCQKGTLGVGHVGSHGGPDAVGSGPSGDSSSERVANVDRVDVEPSSDGVECEHSGSQSREEVRGDQHASERGVNESIVFGKHHKKNKARRDRDKELRRISAGDSGVSGCGAGSVSGGSVRTVDTRTGVEIEAAQTLAARRVAENRMAEAKAKVEAKLAEHRLVALQDKDRTRAVQKLAAARMEEKINKAKKNSEAYFKDCDQSLKSLGSTGSAGEFALKQQIKDARETELLLKYTKAQADLYAIYAAPDVLAKVAALPPPVMQDEFEAFGDCPDYYTEGEREQYYADLNRRNAEKADYCDTGDAW